MWSCEVRRTNAPVITKYYPDSCSLAEVLYNIFSEANNTNFTVVVSNGERMYCYTGAKLLQMFERR